MTVLYNSSVMQKFDAPSEKLGYTSWFYKTITIPSGLSDVAVILWFLTNGSPNTNCPLSWIELEINDIAIDAFTVMNIPDDVSYANGVHVLLNVAAGSTIKVSVGTNYFLVCDRCIIGASIFTGVSHIKGFDVMSNSGNLLNVVDTPTADQIVFDLVSGVGITTALPTSSVITSTGKDNLRDPGTDPVWHYGTIATGYRVSSGPNVGMLWDSVPNDGFWQPDPWPYPISHISLRLYEAETTGVAGFKPKIIMF